MMARSVSWPRCPSSSEVAKITEVPGAAGRIPTGPSPAGFTPGWDEPPATHAASLPDGTNQIRFIPSIRCPIPEPIMELRL